jgi:hypothetical protein
MRVSQKNGPGTVARTGGHFSALTWLSLARLLASRASLRFTKHLQRKPERT